MGNSDQGGLFGAFNSGRHGSFIGGQQFGGSRGLGAGTGGSNGPGIGSGINPGFGSGSHSGFGIGVDPNSGLGMGSGLNFGPGIGSGLNHGMSGVDNGLTNIVNAAGGHIGTSNIFQEKKEEKKKEK